MNNLNPLLQLAPLVGLLVLVVFAVAAHAKSKPHRLNKRDSAPYQFGGPWKNYDPDPDGLHPDEDLGGAGRKTTKPRRRKHKRDRS